MPTTRETAIAALHTALQGITGPQVVRNDPLPQIVPDGGLVILRDGTPGDPEVTLSPTTYHFQHVTDVEIFVDDPVQSDRDTAVDDLIAQVEGVVENDRTLSGAVEWARADTPQFVDDAVEGAPSVKAALVPIVLHYSTPKATG